MSAETITPCLELKGIRKQFTARRQTVTAIHDLSLTLMPGESLAVVGQSGSGKSTLLSIAGTLAQPSEGEVRIRGLRVNGLTERALSDLRGQHIGFVFQKFCLLPHLSLLDNTLLAVQELPGQPAWRERALALLDEVGIADLAERRPAEVSGGQLQRAAIARALLRDPALILADEPTGNLDPENSERVLELLLAQARGDRALVLVTHNEALAQRCQRAVRMVQGRLA